MQEMIGDLVEETSKVGLDIHMGKTKVMTTAAKGDDEKYNI